MAAAMDHGDNTTEETDVSKRKRDPVDAETANESPVAKRQVSCTRVVRIKRQHGHVVQDCDVYIGRSCNQGGWDLAQSKWHNPFTVAACGSAEAAIAKFRTYLSTRPDLLAALPELQGKTLGCWCKPGPCHGDVLVELVNRLA